MTGVALSPVDERVQLAADITKLASPPFEGRGVGTKGLDRAADYLVARFAAIGLVPLEPGRSYRQTFTAASTHPSTTQPTPIANIVGVCSGERTDELVIVGAHYDHLGYGGRGSATPWSHQMHPGADDNASGTSALLALARRFASGPKPRRSILFVCFAGEERGLLGSDYFVHHPPVDLAHVVAMVNLDMIGRLRDDRVYVGGEKTADGFTDLVRRSDRIPQLELKTFTLGGGGPSDHLTFSERHIPVLFFFTGLHADYHTPGDKPEAVNLNGEERIISLVANCVDGLTKMSPPPYREANDQDASILSPIEKRPKMSLGLTLASNGPSLPATVTGVDATSYAAAAIAIGDRLIAVDDRPIHSAADLDDALKFSLPGDEVRLTIERARQQLQQTIHLTDTKD